MGSAVLTSKKMERYSLSFASTASWLSYVLFIPLSLSSSVPSDITVFWAYHMGHFVFFVLLLFPRFYLCTRLLYRFLLLVSISSFLPCHIIGLSSFTRVGAVTWCVLGLA